MVTLSQDLVGQCHKFFMITNLVVDYLLDRYGDLLHNLNQGWLSPQSLQVYADAIHNKGDALDNCWEFIDDTVRPICRPKENQRMLCNGHKRVHALKFQSIATPNGLIANPFGPVEGRRHDSGMLQCQTFCLNCNRCHFHQQARQCVSMET